MDKSILHGKNLSALLRAFSWFNFTQLECEMLIPLLSFSAIRALARCFTDEKLVWSKGITTPSVKRRVNGKVPLEYIVTLQNGSQIHSQASWQASPDQ